MNRKAVGVLADGLAEIILTDAGIFGVEAVDLDDSDDRCDQYPLGILGKISSLLEVTPEIIDGLGRDGECTIAKGQRSIRLLGSQVPTRTVFTFAHELAHIAVKHYESTLEDLAGLRGYALEDFCDRLGGSIALPERWMRSVIHDEPSLHEVYNICQKSQLGPAAVVVRLRELGFECGLLHLRRLADGTHVVATAVGMPHEVRRLVRLDRDASKLFRGLGERSIEDHVMAFVQAERSVKMDVSCCQSPRGAMVLVKRLQVYSGSNGGSASWKISTASDGHQQCMTVPSLKPWDSDPLLMRVPPIAE